MNTKILIPQELFTSFNDVKYYDKPHKYFLNNKELISVTTLLHNYQETFNEEYWADYKGKQFNISSTEIKRAWNFINKKGTIKGSAIHDYAENLFLNKKYEYPLQLILNEFGFDPIWNEYQITKKHVDNFYNDTKGKLIPIKTEFIIYDEESLIGGMLDMLFYNVKMQEFQIWDHKTNKDLTLEMKNRHLLNDLYLLEDCDLELYSLQLEMYKYIIEKNIPIKLGKSYLIWYSHNNDNYKIIETKNRKYYIDLLFKKRINELK